ncbi:MAG: hypothetical protein JNM08_02750 [Rubrivivax sp.]|nr:hypothetical protein [Rubrivivax sp.]
MQKKRLSPIVIALGLAGFTGSSLGLGFGNASPGAVLGQPLDHVVGIRLDPGESLTPDCVSAEVTVGDQRLPGAAVRVRLEGEGANPQVRVQTLMPVDEPVVSVQVVVGCSSRLSRRFTLFADPAPATQPSAPLPPPQALEPTVVDARATAAAAPPPTAPSAPAPAEPRPAPQAVAVPRAPADEARPARARPPVAQRRDDAAVPARTAAPRARLRLDPAEDQTRQAQAAAEAIEAAASAAATLAAAQATAAAASAAAERIATLEKQIERLRADSAADREALQMLRQRAAEGSSAAGWVPWMGALIAALTLLVLWQAVRLKRLTSERQQAWWNAMPQPGGAAPAAAPGAPVAAAAGAALASAPAAAGAPSTGGYSTTRPGALGPVFSADPAPGEPITEPPTLAGERTQVLPVGWREEPEPQRDVSIEELIDLEQQAEFFIVLGQDEAAIDLLVDHLRSTGGGSPLPYLKLLEIYRRRGDREAYERTRARFNHRFNAYAPDWETDATDGRSLEDYPHIIARLQMAWPSPIDAMAELESLLFRKSRGELFDMPAYRDVLFLYSLARDLLDREPVDSGNVDVLLPINEGAEFTQPMSLDSGPGGLDSVIVPLDAQPTVPIDLDVTQPGIPASLFGETATDPGLGGPRRRS